MFERGRKKGGTDESGGKWGKGVEKATDAGVEEEGSERGKRGEGPTDSKQPLSGASRRPLVTPVDVNHPHQMIRWPLVIRTRIGGTR